MKNILEGINSRLGEIAEGISDLEDIWGGRSANGNHTMRTAKRKTNLKKIKIL